jgi:L-asparaginase II
VGSRSRGQGFAIKIADGGKVPLFAATVEVMEQVGWLDEAQRSQLEPWRSREILSVRGAPVGERRTAFKLEF